MLPLQVFHCCFNIGPNIASETINYISSNTVLVYKSGIDLGVSVVNLLLNKYMVIAHDAELLSACAC